MYATGAYTLHSLANWCKKKGLYGNLGKEIALSNVQSILQNIFYIELMKYGGEIHEGQHEPLIPKKLFDTRQEVLTEQITSYLQKVSLSSQDTEKVLAALDSEQDKARESAQDEVIVLKEQLLQVEAKLQKLLDIYLNDALSTEEYTAKKQSLLSQKVTLAEKITDFETKGLSWLEPAREFVKSLNQAANLLSSPNPTAMTTFLKNIGSNHILRNREFVFTPKIEYELVAERLAA